MRIAVHGIDGCLQLVRPGTIARETAAQQRLPFLDAGAIPQIPVLIGEPHQRAIGIAARRAPRVHQQHERQQPRDFGVVGQELQQRATQPQGLVHQFLPLQILAAGGAVSLVEDEIHHGQHAAETRGQVVGIGHAVGNARGLDLRLRARDPLRHRGFGHEEGARDLAGSQAADQTQSQRELRFHGQRGVATGEDQAQSIVRHVLLLVRRVFQQVHRGALTFIARSLAAQPVDGAVARGDDDPASRRGRKAARRPAFQRRCEGLLHGFLGQRDVAELAHQYRDCPAILAAKNLRDIDAHRYPAPTARGRRRMAGPRWARRWPGRACGPTPALHPGPWLSRR